MHHPDLVQEEWDNEDGRRIKCCESRARTYQFRLGKTMFGRANEGFLLMRIAVSVPEEKDNGDRSGALLPINLVGGGPRALVSIVRDQPYLSNSIPIAR